VLDVGCGLGRNLLHLDGNGVGVDTSTSSVEVARSHGLVAYTVEEFPDAPEALTGGFDSLLFAHVLEHMELGEATDLVASYLPYLRREGMVIVIVPQKAGYATDDTHVNFLDHDDVADVLTGHGLEIARSYSFPFPRAAGTVFRHNETVVTARLP
jgi:SAM-dependent methyltransferase